MANKQKGITLMSFVMVMVVVGFFALVAMKLFPMYSENYNLKGVMAEFAKQPNAAAMTPAQVWADLGRRFNISYVTSVHKEHVKIERVPGGRGARLRIAYEVRTPLMGNLDVVGKFDHSVDLGGTPSSE